MLLCLYWKASLWDAVNAENSQPLLYLHRTRLGTGKAILVLTLADTAIKTPDQGSC